MDDIMAVVRRYVALLRGINVGGNKKVPMADLRALLEELGYEDVQTVLQSGNAVFRAPKPEPDRIEAAIADRFGFDVRVLLRTGPELAEVVEGNPFPEVLQEDPKNLHVWFMDKSVEPEVDPEAIAPERVAPGPKVLYVHHPNGAGRSEISKHLNARTLEGATVTARNWNTVLKLAELAVADG
jgi:uncharacterized protein (DUF1697 family)